MNQLEKVAPVLLAQGLMALRGMNSMPALVNSSYNDELANHGDTVNIPIPSAIKVREVKPGTTNVRTDDIAPTSAQVQLDNWKEAPFTLTDRDIQLAMSGIIPMQASEAVKSLMDAVNASILSNYKMIYGCHGDAGHTPFAAHTAGNTGPNDSGLEDATAVRKILNVQLCPMGDRRFVLDPDAEANALNLRAFNDVNWATTPEAIHAGKLTTKLGFQWGMDQQMPYHHSNTYGNAYHVEGLLVAGVNEMTIKCNVGAGKDASIVEGDLFTLPGSKQTYTVISGGELKNAENADGDKYATVTFIPSLTTQTASGSVISFEDSHVNSLAFHRDCIAFVTRPLADVQGLGNIISVMTDPISGVTLRLEISREHKQTCFSYDLLWGSAVVRPELGCRLIG